MLILNNFGDVGLLVLRIVIGIIFLYHGVPKLLHSKEKSESMGMSPFAVFTIGFFEVLGSLGSILGFYAQFSAIALSIVMMGAIYMKIFKWSVPFSKPGGGGWEFDFMILSGAIALLLLGPGSISIDSIIGLYP